MSTIVTLDVPADEFALHHMLESVPGIEFEVERVVAHEGTSVTPYVWISAEETDALEAALADDASVRDAELLERIDSSCLYRMDWVGQIDLFTHILDEEEATVMDAPEQEACWTLRALFLEHDGISRTNEFCETTGLTFNVKTIHEMESERHDRFDLTEPQHETLQAADELDIAYQALSERLRRTHRNLVQDALLQGPRRRVTISE